MDDITPQEPQPGEAPIVDPEASVAEQTGDVSANAQRQRRMFFITFGSIVFAGLALTILYLGGRVMETKAAVKAQLPVQQAAVAKPAAPFVKPAPRSEPKNEAKKEEAPKNQLIAEVKPAAPSKPAPVAESRPAPVPAPAKPAVIAAAKPVPEVVKPPVVAKAPKPQTNLPLVAKAEPPKRAVPVQTSPPPALPAAKHPESKGILQRDAKPYSGPFLKPQAGQVYVQVGAYSPNYTGSFLAILEKKGFHGIVAAGPSQDVNRVLVGPFADTSAVKNTNGELGKAGLTDAFARKY